MSRWICSGIQSRVRTDGHDANSWRASAGCSRIRFCCSTPYCSDVGRVESDRLNADRHRRRQRRRQRQRHASASAVASAHAYASAIAAVNASVN